MRRQRAPHLETLRTHRQGPRRLPRPHTLVRVHRPLRLQPLRRHYCTLAAAARQLERAQRGGTDGRRDTDAGAVPHGPAHPTQAPGPRRRHHDLARHSAPGVLAFHRDPGLVCVVNLSTETFQLPDHTTILLANGPGSRKALHLEHFVDSPEYVLVHSPPVAQALAHTASRPPPNRRYKRSYILIYFA